MSFFSYSDTSDLSSFLWFALCRVWLVAAYNLWDGELERTSAFIADDIRNNSAWSHRWFVLSRWHLCARSLGEADDECPSEATCKTILSRFHAEIAYVHSQCMKAPSCQSCWNELRQLVLQCPETVLGAIDGVAVPELSTGASGADGEHGGESFGVDAVCLWKRNLFAQELQWVTDHFLSEAQAQDGRRAPSASFAVGPFDFAADLHLQHGEKEKAIDLFGLLARVVDPVRCKYWYCRVADVENV